MASIGKQSSAKRVCIATNNIYDQKKSIPNRLTDLIQHIIPRASLSELQSLATTSKEIRKLTLRSANDEAGKFIGQLVPLLKTQKQISDLHKIQSQLNSKIGLTKEKIIHVLKDSDTLETLKQVPVPPFFEKFFEIAEMHRRIPLIAALPDGPEKTVEHKEIAKGLMNLGRIRDAIEMAYTMPNGEDKASLLVYLAETLNKRGNKDLATGMIHTAIETTHALPNGEKKVEIFANIAHKLTDAGAIDWAIDIARALPSDSDEKRPAFDHIIETAKKAKNFDQAIKAIQAISDEEAQRGELIKIIARLAEIGDIDRATHVAETYFPDEISYILSVAARKLSTWGGTIEQAVKLNLTALKIANTLPEGDEKEGSLESIDRNWSEFISYAEGTHRAIELVDFIQDTNRKIENLCWIAETFSTREEIGRAVEMNKRALELTKTLSDGNKKTSFLQNIAYNFVYTREINQAIDVVKAMPNQKLKASTLRAIAHKVCSDLRRINITMPGISSQTIDRSLDRAKEFTSSSNSSRTQAACLLAIADLIDSMGQSDEEKLT